MALKAQGTLDDPQFAHLRPYDPTAYGGRVDMHVHMRATARAGTPGRRWVCVSCRQDVDLTAPLGMFGCTVPVQNGRTCGHGPECAPDCGSIHDALTGPGVHLAGFDTGPDGKGH